MLTTCPQFLLTSLPFCCLTPLLLPLYVKNRNMWGKRKATVHSKTPQLEKNAQLVSRLIKWGKGMNILKNAIYQIIWAKKHKGSGSTDALNWVEKNPKAIPDKSNRILLNVSNRIKIALENSMRTMSLYFCNRPKHQGSLSTGCSPTGFSIPGSVLHTGLAEPRAALPGGGLARACAGGRLEGWAEVTEHKHVIRHTECHQVCYRHLLTQNMQNTLTPALYAAPTLFVHTHRDRMLVNFAHCIPKTWNSTFAPLLLPWASVACFLVSSELQKRNKTHGNWNLLWRDRPPSNIT